MGSLITVTCFAGFICVLAIGYIRMEAKLKEMEERLETLQRQYNLFMYRRKA